jgi:hypothetical protein
MKVTQAEVISVCFILAGIALILWVRKRGLPVQKAVGDSSAPVS